MCYDEVLEPPPVTAEFILLPARLISTAIIMPPLLKQEIKPSAILQQIDVLKGSSHLPCLQKIPTETRRKSNKRKKLPTFKNYN